MAKQKSNKSSNGATVGYEQQLLEDGDGIETNFTEFVVEDTALWLESLGYAGDSYCPKCNN